MVCETVAEDVQACQRTLDGCELTVGRVGEPAGEVRPQPRELLGDEEAPEPEAQLADCLPVACPLALLSHPITGTRDVQARAGAQLFFKIVQPRPRPAEPAMTRGEPAIEGVAQRDLQGRWARGAVRVDFGLAP